MSDWGPITFAEQADDRQRLRTLGALHILHTAREERFDRITRTACEVFDVPFAYVNLIAERYQWTKSQAGDLALDTLPHEDFFCAQTILEHDTMVICDLSTDERFADNRFVTGPPHLSFYAGRPLHAANGHALGTLCILDRSPRFMSDHELDLIDDLGLLVERELEAARAATVDERTGAANRRGFELLAPSLLESAQLNGHDASLIYFDLKSVGRHPDGRDAVRQFARIVQNTVRGSDLFAVVGDNEFALLAAKAAGGHRVIERLRESIATFQDTRRPAYTLDFRYGISTTDADASIAYETLLESARAKAERARD